MPADHELVAKLRPRLSCARAWKPDDRSIIEQGESKGERHECSREVGTVRSRNAGWRDRAANRQRISRLAPRRPHRLHLRRARERRHHASGVPQHGAHGGAALRRAARPQTRRQDPGADRYRQRRQDPCLLQGAENAGRSIGRAQRHRRMGEDHLWLARPLTRLQGRIPGDAGRQCRVLRSVQRQCPALVQIQPGARSLRQSCHHPSAGRPRPAAQRGRRHLLPRGKGDRRRHRRVRRQGGGDGIGADQLHLRRPSRPDPGSGQEFRRRVHGADQPSGRQIHLPHLL